MDINLRKVSVPTAVFFAIAVVSVGWVAYPLWNYTRFYMALWNFDYTLSNITVDASNPAVVLVRFELLISNPTSYSGLSVNLIRYSLQYKDGEHEIVIGQGKGTKIITTNLWDLNEGSFGGGTPIPPEDNRSVSVSFSVSSGGGSNSEAFLVFLRTMPSQVEWSLNCDLVLSSFLGGFDVQRSFFPKTQMSY